MTHLQEQRCDRCGAAWQIAWKCQIMCPNCGARLDCSDLYVEPAGAARHPRGHPAEGRLDDE